MLLKHVDEGFLEMKLRFNFLGTKANSNTQTLPADDLEALPPNHLQDHLQLCTELIRSLPCREWIEKQCF